MADMTLREPKQSTRFLYRNYGTGLTGSRRRHFLEAFGGAIKCRSKREALALEKKLNNILKNHDKRSEHAR